MGRDVAREEMDDPALFSAKVRQCLDVFEQLLDAGAMTFDERHFGVEIEFNLVGADGSPVLRNVEALDAIRGEEFQSELGRFNIEVNVPPGKVAGTGLTDMAVSLRTLLNSAEVKASDVGAHLIMVGILPSISAQEFDAEALSAEDRYHLLSEEIISARGENIEIAIRGAESLKFDSATIMPEAACTSTQLHLQVSPDEFASQWNAAQAVAGVQVAVGANSPFLLGRQLWHETRIALFEQATDTRTHQMRANGVRPRVWFGDRWIDSVSSLFAENSEYFEPLLPVLNDEDPQRCLDEGRTPRLAEMCLHNGSIWRWNRPVYDASGEAPHLRIENRVLPAGPTIIDMHANAALFFGLVAELAAAEQPVWEELVFVTAERNFHRAARDGLGARLWWPGIGDVGAAELILGTLLPVASAGLNRLGVAESSAARLLGVIEGRARTGQTGAQWLIDGVRDAPDRDRQELMRAVTLEYRERMHTGVPVHEWLPAQV